MGGDCIPNEQHNHMTLLQVAGQSFLFLLGLGVCMFVHVRFWKARSGYAWRILHQVSLWVLTARAGTLAVGTLAVW